MGQLQHLLRALQSYSRKVGFKKYAKEESISKLGKTGISKSGKIGSANPFSGSAAIRKKGSIGSINEVDLLLACPQGILLIEIKSNPGTLRGDTLSWTWEHEGRRKTVENPLLLANRKCKRLKSLLGRQRAFKKEAQPFIDPIVFLSHPDVKCFLSGVAANNVRLRDQDASQGEGTERAGIMGAIRRRECPGLRQFQFSPVNRPTIRAVALAMDQAGIRPSQNARRVGDFLLDQLIFDSPTGSYQDWMAKHAAIESATRLARIYMVARQTTEEQRKIIKKAAFREFQLLERLDHPGILKTEPPTECEYGPVLFFRRDPSAVPLDHFLRDEGDSLAVDQRLDTREKPKCEAAECSLRTVRLRLG